MCVITRRCERYRPPWLPFTVGVLYSPTETLKLSLPGDLPSVFYELCLWDFLEKKEKLILNMQIQRVAHQMWIHTMQALEFPHLFRLFKLWCVGSWCAPQTAIRLAGSGLSVFNFLFVNVCERLHLVYHRGSVCVHCRGCCCCSSIRRLEVRLPPTCVRDELTANMLAEAHICVIWSAFVVIAVWTIFYCGTVSRCSSAGPLPLCHSFSLYSASVCRLQPRADESVWCPLTLSGQKCGRYIIYSLKRLSAGWDADFDTWKAIFFKPKPLVSSVCI